MARLAQFLLVLVGLFRGAMGGCMAASGDDDTVVVTDDDDTGDDDDSTDDDTGDDDTAQGPCTYSDEWHDVLAEDDAQGDADGYLLDIRALQYQFADPYLYLRLQSWEPFDLHDGDLAVQLMFKFSNLEHALTWDYVRPNPGPLQFWCAINLWQEPLELPESMHFCSDEDDSLVLGIDPQDLTPPSNHGYYARVGVHFWGDGGHADIAPDDGSWLPLTMTFEPEVVPGALTFVETDGDGVIEPGETVEIRVPLHNQGLSPTGGQLTATATLASTTSAPANLAVDGAVYGGGAPLAGGDEAGPDEPLQLVVDGDALPGHGLDLDIVVTDDAGHEWAFTPATLVVGYPVDVPLTTLLTDGDDSEDAMDIAAVSYSVSAAEMVFLIESHGPHAAAAVVDLFVDTDLDGEDDYLLSSWDPDAGTFTGRLFEAGDEGWTPVGYAATFNYTPGNDYLAIGVELAHIGDPPYVRIHVQSHTNALDRAPDLSGWAPNRPLAVAVESPLLGLGEYTLSEALGDGDVHIEPGEEWDVTLAAYNYGHAVAEDVEGTLVNLGGGITLLAGQLVFGEVQPGEVVWATEPARFRVDAGSSGATQYQPKLWAVPAGYPMGDASVADAIPVGVGVLPGDTAASSPTISGTINLFADTRLFVDSYGDPSACTGWPAAGSDAVYGLQMTAGMVLAVTTVYQTYPPDASIYISDDATHPDLACLAGSDSQFGVSGETLNFTAPVDGLYYLVVDAYETGGGPFDLSLIFY